MSNDITNLIDDANLKFIFVGGKGGVGKTTTSSALASQLAFSRKVLLISTDPAHSLSDAFRMQFSSTPQQIPGIANLEVMEVNPTKVLKEELHEWFDLVESAGITDFVGKIHEFQEFLSSLPGIDEATALSSVISLVESGKYDTIVFDTAPTGHTLKLLQLPKVMQAGLEKLESWQSTMWGYWEMIKGQGQAVDVKREVAKRIRSYKHGIERVGLMLKDSHRTKFVVVCIAEFLSINETMRLLHELKRHEVAASNVVCNQLITNVLSPSDLDAIRSAIPSDKQYLFDKIQSVSELTTARNAIQQKYLDLLKTSEEARGLRIIEIPLLPSEITGPRKLIEFSQNLVPANYRTKAQIDNGPTLLRNREERTHMLYEDAIEDDDDVFVEGEKIMLVNLTKSPQYNGKIGQVVKVSEDGRVVIRVRDPADPNSNKFKVLSLRPENLEHVVVDKPFL
jgi:arsenite/tail-anchored protein-transporting ATPase